MVSKNSHFKDHFSIQSEEYKLFRPGYPVELFDYLASLCAQRQLAWDCATGNGQAAAMMAEYFEKVVASDASETQIKNNLPVDNIEYQVMPAEHTDLASQSVDLITIAQALHWFDREAFFKEAQRVLKPDSILAVWGYNLLSINDDVDRIVNHLYDVTLHKYWPIERAMIENNYADIKFPFARETAPAFSMKIEWTLGQLIGYLSTWSATKAYIKSEKRDPVALIADELSQAWNNSKTAKNVTWPLTLIICRNKK